MKPPKPKRKPKRGPVFPNKPKVKLKCVPRKVGLWDIGGAGVALTHQAIESRSDLEKAWAKDDEAVPPGGSAD